MVEIGDLPEGGGYGIARRVSGGPIEDLDEAGMRAVLPRLFEAMDAMRDADLQGTSGYGLWHGDGRADRSSWRDAFVGDAATQERAKQRAMLAQTAVGHVGFDVGIARMSELVRWSSEDRFLVHNDLLYRNVFLDADGLVLLDWGASIFGDFLYDAALLTFWWPWYAKEGNSWGRIDIRAEIERHYDGIGLRIPNFRERLRLCELDIGVVHIAYQAAGGLFGHAVWTARRTAELAERDLASSD
jgi:aminoglycoside phosphotransferase (APT) family kinase protein